MINTLCISGGGVKGICVLGCIKNLIKNNIIVLNKINNYYCCSAGSIISFLLALNYTTKELCYIWKKLPLHKYNIQFNIDNLFINNGLDNGNNIMIILQTMLYKKYNQYDITFKQFYETFNKKINIIATNLTKFKEELFSYETTPNMSVLIAIRMSIAIPIIFTPVIYNNNVYVDGGLVNNFPYKYIKDKFIGIVTQFYPTDTTINIFNIIMNCSYQLMINNNNINSINNNNIILITNNNMYYNEVSIKNKNFNKLYKLGYKITNKWINKYICSNIINNIINTIDTNLS